MVGFAESLPPAHYCQSEKSAQPKKELDIYRSLPIIGGMSYVSTAEVAKVVGVSESTLERWLSDGKIKPPKLIQLGQRKSRLWTVQDIKRIRLYKKKFYWKGRGGKPKAKR